MHVYIINWRVVHRQYLYKCLLSTHNHLVGWNKCPIVPRDDGYRQRRKSWVACGTIRRGMSAVLTRPWRKSLHHRKTAVCDINPVPYTFFIRLYMSVPLTPSADKNWITARWACLEESMTRSLTVISLLLQSITHCRYRVYSKFLLTYTAIYRGNRKVLPLGITALQPQSHFHLGTPYTRTDVFNQY